MEDFLKGGASSPQYSQVLDTLEKREKETRKPKARFLKEHQRQAFTSVLHKRENYDNYLFRASGFGKMASSLPKPLTPNQADTYNAYHDRFMGLGKALTPNQEKLYYELGAKMRAKPELSQGAKTYCEELVREDVFGRRKIIETKYMDKGIEMEEASIALYSEFIGQELSKNTQRMSNDYWMGEADNTQGKIRDFKTSWKHSTFPRAATEIKNKEYDWQLQIYMDLYGFEKAELVFCLVDTPPRLVEKEIQHKDWDYNILDMHGNPRDDQAIDFIVELVSDMTYTWEGLGELCDQSGTIQLDWFEDSFIELPIEKRIKVFTTQRDDKLLQQGREIVKLAREYMNKIKEV